MRLVNENSSEHSSTASSIVENSEKHKMMSSNENNSEKETITCEESIENIKNYCQNYIIDTKHISFLKSENKKVFPYINNHQSKRIQQVPQQNNKANLIDPCLLHQQHHHVVSPNPHALNNNLHHNGHFAPTRPFPSYNPLEMIYTTAIKSNTAQCQQPATEYVAIRYFAPVHKIINDSLNETNLNNSNVNILDTKVQPFTSNIYSNELLQQYKSIDFGSSNHHLVSYDRPISSLWNLTGGDSRNSSTSNRNHNQSLGINTKSANNFINKSSLYANRKGGAGSTNYSDFLDITPKDQDFKRFLKIGLITAFISILIVAVVVGSVLGATLTGTKVLSRSDLNDKNFFRSSILNDNQTTSNLTTLSTNLKENFDIDLNFTIENSSSNMVTKPKIKTIFNKTFILKPKTKLNANFSTNTKKSGTNSAVLSSVVQEEENLLNDNLTETSTKKNLAMIAKKQTFTKQLFSSTIINMIATSNTTTTTSFTTKTMTEAFKNEKKLNESISTSKPIFQLNSTSSIKITIPTTIPINHTN